MDINDFRSWHTVIMLVMFVGIIVWAYSKGRKHSFDEAANLPFAENDHLQNQATIEKEKLS